tara:strand:+ start:1328 stop:1582 length:255 start_codon:yes stop_codon:yes gene_type:complete
VRDHGVERVAENTYLKLLTRIGLPIVGGLALFMLVRLVDQFDDFAKSITKTQQTVAVHGERLDGHDDDIMSLLGWLRRVSERLP